MGGEGGVEQRCPGRKKIEKLTIRGGGGVRGGETIIRDSRV